MPSQPRSKYCAKVINNIAFKLTYIHQRCKNFSNCQPFHSDSRFSCSLLAVYFLPLLPLSGYNQRDDYSGTILVHAGSFHVSIIHQTLTWNS